MFVVILHFSMITSAKLDYDAKKLRNHFEILEIFDFLVCQARVKPKMSNLHKLARNASMTHFAQK